MDRNRAVLVTKKQHIAIDLESCESSWLLQCTIYVNIVELNALCAN